MRLNNRLKEVLLLSLFSVQVFGHQIINHKNSNDNSDHAGYAHYLGNEGLLLVDGNTKVLFDPFFHKDFNQYQSVPQHIINKIHNGESPYNNVSAVFISHAHDDHFTAKTVADYLVRYPNVKLIAPQQAVDKLSPFLDKSNREQLIAVDLNFGDKVWRKELGALSVDAIRIPHAGRPGRAGVQNIVFRVAFNSGTTVMHMGDADPDDDHYLPYRLVWQEKITHTAFPPYWFFYSAEGRDILGDIINAERHIGIHVPVKVPAMLKNGDYLYFSQPGSEKALR